MSQINEVYPNIENPEGLDTPDIVSEKTTFIFPVSGPEPQQPDHYVTKQYLTNTTQVPIGGIIMWSGSITDIPNKWALCDGQNSTPDLRERFIVGASDTVGSLAGITTSVGTNVYTLAFIMKVA